MWPFMKDKPKPPAPMPECFSSIEETRKYVLAEIECYYKRILAELSVTDPESLSRLAEIINDYNEIDSKVAASLSVMQSEISALHELMNNTSAMHYELKKTYDPASLNLSYQIREVE